jgi:type II secretory pathway pseudopilin PulG
MSFASPRFAPARFTQAALRERGANRHRPWRNIGRAFTLLEVMIAVAFIGIAMLALLSLHQNNLHSVIRAQQLTTASMLAQQLMSTAEADRFPPPGTTRGDFSRDYPGLYKNYRWQREVAVMPQFPDIRRVRVRVFYGPNFDRHFELLEFMHNPTPPQQPRQPASGADNAADNQSDEGE